MFKSEANFKLWKYSASHSTLLLRNINLYEEKDLSFNIDIEFWGVAYIEIPEILKGITLEEIKTSFSSKVATYVTEKETKVFQIHSNGEVFLIVATGYLIGRNRWELNDRIDDPTLQYEEIYAQS